MIRVEDYSIFQNHMSTLKETSKDDHDGNEVFMTTSLLPVVDFDAVKDEYIEKLRVCENPKSNDALFVDGGGKSVFIEFKNGYMDRKKQFDVRKKVFDSLLLFTDIIGKGISYTRKHTNYILVYNEAKSLEDEKTKVQSSESRDQIANIFMRRGGSYFIKFGLEIFKNYCFNNVYTYTEEEFENSFVKEYSET